MLAGAHAQTPPAVTPVTKYDGTYAFVSWASINKTYVTAGTERVVRCGVWHLQSRGPLTIVKGRAHHPGPHRDFEGTVGPQGDLIMRAAPEPYGRCAGCFPGLERFIAARIDGNGTVRAVFSDNICNFELIWQKQSK
jgi:hypothetical protein